MNTETGFTALVLAGDRRPDDPVACAAGVTGKALVPVAGIPMVCRVVKALEASGVIDRTILIGPAELRRSSALDEWFRSGRVEWMPSLSGPSASAAAALSTLEPGARVLLTTADHALLQGEIVADFLHGAAARECDMAVGVVDYQHVRDALPGSRRTVMRLADGEYCGCNLFAFLTPRGRTLAAYWERTERSRKRPARLLLQVLGLRGLFGYLTGTLTLAAALHRVSLHTGATIAAVPVTAPLAAVDVDTPADHALVERILQDSGIT